MNSAVWKSIAIALMTFILGAGGSYAISPKNGVTRADVRDMILTEAPPQSELKALKEEIVTLQIEQARMNEKLDLLLKRVGGK